MKRILFCLAFLTACSGATGPTQVKPLGHDPVILASNSSPDTLYVHWYLAGGLTGNDIVPTGAQHCLHINVVADSIGMYVDAHTPNDSTSFQHIGPGWFGPPADTVPYWTLTATPSSTSSATQSYSLSGACNVALNAPSGVASP